MPHLSRKKLSESILKETDKKLYDFFLVISDRQQRKIFGELATDTEKKMLAKRIMMVYLIYKNLPTHEISERLGVSSSTVARFEFMVENGKFKNSINWLKDDTIGKKILNILGDLIAVPFEADEKSFSQIIRERH